MLVRHGGLNHSSYAIVPQIVKVNAALPTVPDKTSDCPAGKFASPSAVRQRKFGCFLLGAIGWKRANARNLVLPRAAAYAEQHRERVSALEPVGASHVVTK